MPEKRRIRLIILVIAGLAVTVGVGVVFNQDRLSAAISRPAVLLVSVSSLSPDAFSAERPHFAPQLDLLRKEGIWFDQAYTTSTRQGSALASLLSGETVRAHHVARWGDRLPRQLNRFAQIGSKRRLPLVACTGFKAARALGVEQDFDEVLAADEDDPRVSASFLNWLDRERQGGKPFAAWLNFSGLRRRPPAAVQRLAVGAYPRAEYDEAVSQFDYQLGRLVVGLEQRGYDCRRNLILIIVGDRGELITADDPGLPRPGPVAIVPATARVALLWLSPNAAAGEVVSHPVQVTDVIPTLAAAYRVTLDGYAGEGRNLFAPPFARTLAIETAGNDPAARQEGLIVKEWLYARDAVGPVTVVPLARSSSSPPLNPDAVAARFSRFFPADPGVERTPNRTRDGVRALGYLH